MDSDEYQLALKYLKDTEFNICNVLVLTRNIDIKNKD